VYNVRINVTSMSDRSLGEGLINEAKQVMARTAAAARKVESIVERQLT
jgi:formiminotetrahydrofolate cyclodeaminase